MTALRDAAENATAGVPVQVAYDLENVKQFIQNARWAYVSNSEAFKHNFGYRLIDALEGSASELNTARVEIGRLTKLVEQQFAKVDALTVDLERVGRQSASATSALTAAQARIAELEGLVQQAEAIFTHCTVSDGVCCCGDSMENHSDPMWCGHSPVDHGGYVADGWLAEARATLSPAVKEPK